MQRSQVRIWALGFAFYTLFASLFAVQRVAIYAARGETAEAKGILLTFLGIYTWAALTPVIFWVSRRYPLGRRGRWRNLLAHLAAMAVIIPVDIGVYALLDHALFHSLAWDPMPSLGGKFLRLLAWGFAGDVLWYGGVVATSHALTFHGMVRERERTSRRTENRLHRSRLAVLKMQLHPHFLFNTLHAVSSLIGDDPATARRMLARLRKLVRGTLAGDRRQEVSLRDELDFLDSYLEIQLTRFPDRLSVRREIPWDVLEARVPNLILQPLVENAIRHGFAAHPSHGTVDISAKRVSHLLRLVVTDNGSGLPQGGDPLKEGVGLSNTRARLQQLYGDAHVLALGNTPGGGTQVVIEIPFHTRADRVEAAVARATAGRPHGTADMTVRPLTWSWAPAVLIAWLIFGFLLAGQSVFLTAPGGERVEPERFYLLGYQSVLWAAFTILIFWACARFPLGQARWGRNLAAHLVLNALLLGVGMLLLVALDQRFGWLNWFEPVPRSFVGKLGRVAVANFEDYVFRYWMVVGIGHALAYQRLYRERDLRASQLESQLSESELQLLSLQLQPDFLVDTLRAIEGRVERDPAGAERMLMWLADLLRLLFESTGREVSLAEELTSLEPYLKIQQARFEDQLTVRREVDPDALAARVPNLVLQPLVEHAMRHRMNCPAGRNAIEIRAAKRNGSLKLEVNDVCDAAVGDRGVAEGQHARYDTNLLLTTRSRLRQLYGADHRFELQRSSAGGLRIAVEIPYQVDAA